MGSLNREPLRYDGLNPRGQRLHCLVVVLTLVGLCVPGSGIWVRPLAAQFLPPGVVNPFADVDPGQDQQASHVIEDDGTMHVVWASSNDYPGIGGGDPDILYSKNSGSGWSAPIAVNIWALADNDVDERPRLALGPGGRLYCVWQSRHDFLGTGTDWDIFLRVFDPATGWGPVEYVNHFATIDNISADRDDTLPNLAVRGDGVAVIVWQKPVYGGHGLYWRWRNDIGWGANSEKLPETAVGPAGMATSAGGDIIIVWSRTDSSTGSSYPVWTEIPSGQTTMSTVHGWGYSPGDGLWPAVTTYGTGDNLERHFVWQQRFDGGHPDGTDYDIQYADFVEGDTGVYTVHTVNSTAATDGANDDLRPSICVEPGGVVHIVWQSTVDVLTGTDLDTYHAYSGTTGNQWSPIGLLGLNAPFDSVGEDDFDPEIRCTSGHGLSAMWTSTDDLGGTVGNDRDVFHSLGTGRRYHRSRPIADWAESTPSYDGKVRMASHGGIVHLIWESSSSGGSLGTGPDSDIYTVRYSHGQFGEAELVNRNRVSGFTGDDGDPDIAIDPQGRVHAVWASPDNIGGTAGSDYDIFYAWRDSDLGWSEPVLVDSGATSDSVHDFQPRIEIDGSGDLHVAWLQMLNFQTLQLAYSHRTSVGWSSVEIPTVPTATVWNPNSFDLAVERSGIAHIVWNSSADPAVSAGEFDVFWSRRISGSWSPAEVVNDYASNDSDDDFTPRIAVLSGSTAFVIWSSAFNRTGEAGFDSDLYVSQRDLSGQKATGSWDQAALLVNHFKNDQGDDYEPQLVVGHDYVEVVWESSDGLAFGSAGPDMDIFHVRVSGTSTFPADVGVGVANANGFMDSGRDENPAIEVLPGGTSIFAWETDDSFGEVIGTDVDVILGRLGEVEGIFCDGFESGTSAAWSN